MVNKINMIATITEGDITVEFPVDSRQKLDSKVPVFYNPVMRLNRDISIMLLNCLERKNENPFKFLDLLAASGIRALRIKKEVPNVDVVANDINPIAVKVMKESAKKNKLKITVEDKSAFVLLSRLESYNFIDIDPFGTPIPFVDAAIKRVSPHGYLSVTATDTSALCGTYESACKRKYSSKPLRNEFMHEIGIRILIRKVQEIAAQYDVALTPIFSHSSNHYMKIYLKKETGAGKTNKILKSHGYIFYDWETGERKVSSYLFEKPEKWDYAGPLWIGELWDKKLVSKMSHVKGNFSSEAIELVKSIKEESKYSSNIVGYYDMHLLAKKHKFRIPKLNDFIEEVRKKGKKAVKTHFCRTGFKTDLEFKELKKILL